MCVIPSDLNVSIDLEATKGPSKSPGKISWHSRRISYLGKNRLLLLLRMVNRCNLTSILYRSDLG